jgi:carbon monoxide dehydrogenase subunit G
VIEGERTADVAADAERVYEVLADAAGFSRWQSLVSDVEILETGPDGRPLLSRGRLDAKIRTVTVVFRYRYDPPRVVSWTAEKGSDIKAMEGSFTVEPTGPGSCHVRYVLGVDPGRRLGLLARGPVVDKIRNRLLDGTLADLKRFVET